jgi:hypothetical protein
MTDLEGRSAPDAYGEQVLTANDSEPPVGSVVTDDTGMEWVRLASSMGFSNWLPLQNLAADYESWTKVAGNYGPVTWKFRDHQARSG